jgi:hypothetical protein
VELWYLRPVAVTSWRRNMKPHKLLRAASVLTVAHALLNTFAGLLSGTSHAQDETAVLNAMQSVQFDAMGSLRTYWDFYLGFGLFLTASLLLLSVLTWQLAALAKAEPAKARAFIASLCIAFLAFSVLSSVYFFLAPAVLELVIAALLGLAYVGSRE